LAEKRLGLLINFNPALIKTALPGLVGLRSKTSLV
jgi:hypothetical protein